MYRDDLALNNRQWLICHKTQTNQTKPLILHAGGSIGIKYFQQYLATQYHGFERLQQYIYIYT